MTTSTVKRSALTKFIDFVQHAIGFILGYLGARLIGHFVVAGATAMFANPVTGLCVAVGAIIALYFFTNFYESMIETGIRFSKWVFTPIMNWSVRRDERKAVAKAAADLADTLRDVASSVVAEAQASEDVRDDVAARGTKIVTEGMQSIGDILRRGAGMPDQPSAA